MMNEWLQGRLFLVFRGLVFLGLLGLGAAGLVRGDRSVGLFVHLILLPLWFGPTLWMGLRRSVAGRLRVLRCALFSAVDVSLVMLAAAEFAVAAERPFGLLGGYVFLVAALCGPVAGSACALAGFIGYVNGWLLRLDAWSLRNLLVGGGTALAGVVGGMAWRQGVPLLVRAIAAARAAGTPALDITARLTEMETRLRMISEERDRAQERLSEMEEERIPEPVEPMSALVANVDTVRREGDAAPGGDPHERIRQLEEEAAQHREEKRAYGIEKRKLMAEISAMARDLMAIPPKPAASSSKEDDVTKAAG